MKTEKIAYYLKKAGEPCAVVVHKDDGYCLVPYLCFRAENYPDYSLAGVYDTTLPTFSKRRLAQDINCARMDARAA